MVKKTITGYCEPLSLRAGQQIKLFASSHTCEQVKLDLVRIICGDPTRTGPGFNEQVLTSALPTEIKLSQQPLTPGSFAHVDLSDLMFERRLIIKLFFFATRPDDLQTVLQIGSLKPDDYTLQLCDQDLIFSCGAGCFSLSDKQILAKRWYQIEIAISTGANAHIETSLTCLPSRSPGRDLGVVGESVRRRARLGTFSPDTLTECLFGASNSGHRFDGRIAQPQIIIDEVALQWDFSQQVSGSKIIDVSGNERHGLLHQLPARAVTGPLWDGEAHDWRVRPEHYDAIHFHSDDLYDANWQSIATLELPPELPSGIYAFRLTGSNEIDRIPFFVRPALRKATANVALLMSSCTYMAYANHRMLFEGADFVSARNKLRPEHEYIRDHPELGLSMYEKHKDGSGVMYSSRRRPILQLRPGADGWNFTPDTNINAFLHHLSVNHDVIADEDLHAEGFSALASYRVIVTGSHPEYWSTAMIEALEKWQRNGGRLMYLGGNGFYWRVAFSDEWPGAIELRRAEDGVRNWQTETGESYHSFNGEYGGLWRRLGRAPNELVGVGFAAQGFERAVGYRRTAASYDSRAAWIFDGVDDDVIGTSGLGGGAAGQEVDRYNEQLGSPSHAVILASATDFGADMTRTKEELEAAIIVPTPDPVVRADMVFFETPAGGAVFSVGSIAWFGALARNGYANDVAKITENVLRRFIDPTPFDNTPA